MRRSTILGLLFLSACFGYAARAVLAAQPPSDQAPRVFFRGSFAGIAFCQNGEGELFIEGGQVRVACADQRAVPITVLGKVTVDNVILDCRNWCPRYVAIARPTRSFEEWRPQQSPLRPTHSQED